MRDGGRRSAALLLPRAPVGRRQLPHVPGRSEGRPAQAYRLLRHGGQGSAARPERRAAGGRDQFADGAQGAQGRAGIPADQPSARLPDLRPGRRMRPAGPDDGLRRRLVALRREQARRRGQVPRPAGQDLDEPLHPLHALHPLLDRGRRRLRARRDRPRRGHGDHALPRAHPHFRAAGQRRRSLPGRRADFAPDLVPCPAVGIFEDRDGRRDGRHRLGDPRRCARPRSRAHPAAGQRGDQRGVDLRQDPPHRRRPEDPAPRPALRADRRQADAGDLAAGLRRDRRQGQVDAALADRRAGRRSRQRRRDVRPQGADGPARRRQRRLSPGRREARSASSAAPATCSTRRSPASTKPTRS